MADKPSGWNRMMARLAGEVPAGELEAFRRASGPVFDLMDQVERRRLECRIDGLDPWTVPPATRAAFLCAWNAFVLQTVANDLVDADHALEPRTQGHVPPVTAAQARSLYRQVDGWVSRGWQAQANPGYRLDVAVPVPLPPWQREERVPPAHLHGLLHAMRAVHGHAVAAMAFLPDAVPEDGEKQAQLHRIRQLHASAQVQARYADEMGTQDAPAVRERAAGHARAAIEQFYLLGQLVADPALASTLPAGKAPRRPAPGGPVHPAQTIVPRLAEEWPVGAQPPDTPGVRHAPPAAPSAREPVAKLVTRRDDHRGLTLTEPDVAVELTATLLHAADFVIRPSLLRRRDGQAVALRVYARGLAGFTGLTDATLTLRADAAGARLVPWPNKRSRVSTIVRRSVYEEHAAFPLPRGMLNQLCAAQHLSLRFETSLAALEVDAGTIARLQALLRAFRRALEDRDRDPRHPRTRRNG